MIEEELSPVYATPEQEQTPTPEVQFPTELPQEVPNKMLDILNEPTNELVNEQREQQEKEQQAKAEERRMAMGSIEAELVVDKDRTEQEKARIVGNFIKESSGSVPRNMGQFEAGMDKVWSGLGGEGIAPNINAVFDKLQQKSISNKKTNDKAQDMFKRGTRSVFTRDAQDPTFELMTTPMSKEERKQFSEAYKIGVKRQNERYGARNIAHYHTVREDIDSGIDFDIISEDVADFTVDMSGAEKSNYLSGLRESINDYPTEKRDQLIDKIGKNARISLERAGDFVTDSTKTAIKSVRAAAAGFFNESQKETNPIAQRAQLLYETSMHYTDMERSVKDILMSEVEPLDYVTDDNSIGRTFEDAAYAVPQVAVSVATIAAPMILGGVLGAGGFALNLARGTSAAAGFNMSASEIMESKRQGYLQGGADFDTASNKAAGMSTYAQALPHYFIERMKVGQLTRKSGVMNSIMGKLDNSVRNRGLRYLAKAGVQGVVQTAEEMGQNIYTEFVKDVTNVLDSEMADVVWSNGEDGVFDEFWAESAVTFLTMAPFAVWSAGGLMSAENRAAQWAKLPELHLKAYGYDEQSIANLKNANSPRERTLAHSDAEDTKNGKSESAKEAVDEINKALLNQQEAIQQAQYNGNFPVVKVSFEEGKPTYRVYEPKSENLMLETDNPDEATESAMVWVDKQADAEDARFIFLNTLMKASARMTEKDPDSVKMLNTGEVMTRIMQMAENPDTARRLAEQAEMAEIASGGDGSLARIQFNQPIYGSNQVKIDETGQAKIIDTIYHGGNIMTLIHEEGHANFKRGVESGAIDLQDTINLLRKLDKVMGDRMTKGTTFGRDTQQAKQLRFLKGDAEPTFAQVDEAVAELWEALIMGEGRFGSMRELIKENMKAYAQMGVGNTITNFVRALRHYFNLALTRSMAIKKAVRDGVITKDEINAFRAKMQGTTEQEEINAEARQRFDETLRPAFDESYSIGTAQDATFLELAKNPKQNEEKLQAMVDARAESMGYNPLMKLYHGTKKLFDKFKSDRDPNKLIYFSKDRNMAETYPRGSGGHRNPEADVQKRIDDAQQVSRNYTEGAFEKLEAEFGSDIPQNLVDEVFEKEKDIQRDALDGMTVTQAQSTMGIRVIEGYVRADKIFETSNWREFSTEIMESIGVQSESEIEPQMMRMIEAGSYIVWENTKVVDAVLSKYDAMAIQESSDGDADTIAFRDPSQIKSADPVTYDSDGNVIPLSQRFDESRDEISFSIGDTARHGIMQSIQERVDKPQLKAEMLGDAVRNVQELIDKKNRLVEELKTINEDGKTVAQLNLEEKLRVIESEIGAMDQAYDHDVKRLESEHEIRKGDIGEDIVAQFAHRVDFAKGKKKAELKREAKARESERQKGEGERFKLEKKNLKSRLKAEKANLETEAEKVRTKLATKDKESQRKMIRDMLVTYEALLMTLPTDIRGKMGKSVRIVDINTDEKILDFFEKKLDRLERVMDSYIGRKFNKSKDKLFKRATIKKQSGKKDKGKLKHQIHDVFQSAKDASKMTEEKVMAEIASLDSILESQSQEQTLTDSEIDVIKKQKVMIQLFGNWKELSNAEKEAALINGWTDFEYNFTLSKLEQAEERARRLAAIDEAIKSTGVSPDDANYLADLKDEEGNKLKSRLRSAAYGLVDFEQFLTKVFGEDSKVLDFVNREQKADAMKIDRMRAHEEAISQMFEEIAGSSTLGVKAAKLQHQMQNTRYVTKTQKRSLTQLQMIQARLMWRQPEGRKHMEGRFDEDGKRLTSWSYDQKFMDEIDSLMTNEARAVEQFLMDQYQEEWADLNAVHQRVQNATLPRNYPYAPLTVAPAITKDGEVSDPDPITGQSIKAMKGTDGFLLRRNKGAVAEPVFRDALSTFLVHKTQVEHWMAYAEFNRDLATIAGSREARKSIKAKTGAEGLKTLDGWTSVFANNGLMQSYADTELANKMNRAVSRTSQAILFGRLSVLAIQSTQLGAAAAQMPTMSYTKRLGMLMAGQLEFKKAFNSDFIQRRMSEAPPAVRLAMQNMASGKPNVARAAAEKMGTLIAGTDAFFTAGTYAIIFDYLTTNKGMSEKDAHAQAERLTEQVAQPTRMGRKSLLEMQFSRQPTAKLAWAFASEPRQKMMLMAFRMSENGVFSKEAARAAITTVVFGGVFASLIRTIGADVRDDDDEEVFDAKYWNPMRLALNSVTAPLQGVPVFGDLAEYLLLSSFKALGADTGYLFSGGNIFSNAGDMGFSLVKLGVTMSDLAQQDPDAEIEDALKHLDRFLSGMGVINNNAAAAASFSHLMKDLFMIGKNIAK